MAENAISHESKNINQYRKKDEKRGKD